MRPRRQENLGKLGEGAIITRASHHLFIISNGAEAVLEAVDERYLALAEPLSVLQILGLRIVPQLLMVYILFNGMFKDPMTNAMNWTGSGKDPVSYLTC
ncbi:unnamed protein product [Pylaiella littoralis]